MGETIQLLLRTLRVGCCPYLNHTVHIHSRADISVPREGCFLTPRRHHCRCLRFAEEMARLAVMQMEKAHAIIDTFSFEVCTYWCIFLHRACSNRQADRQTGRQAGRQTGRQAVLRPERWSYDLFTPRHFGESIPMMLLVTFERRKSSPPPASTATSGSPNAP